MGELGSVEQSVAGLLAQLPPTLRELPTSLATVRAATVEVDPAMRALLPAAHSLAPALSALRSVSPVAQTALTALDQPLPRLHALLSAAAPTAGKLDAAFAALRPQAPKLNAITAALVPCELGIQDFFQYTLSVTKLATPHGVLPRGFGVFGPQVATGMLGATNLFSELNPSPSCAPGGPS
jgi:ABC-type transporter Mla subunit MlaD